MSVIDVIQRIIGIIKHDINILFRIEVYELNVKSIYAGEVFFITIAAVLLAGCNINVNVCGGSVVQLPYQPYCWY